MKTASRQFLSMDPGHDCAERLEGIRPNTTLVERLKKRSVRKRV